MNYIDSIKFLGVEAKQIPCMILNGPPTTSIEGAVGMLGMDVDSESHDLYKCVEVDGDVYTWELVESSSDSDYYAQFERLQYYGDKDITPTESEYIAGEDGVLITTGTIDVDIFVIPYKLSDGSIVEAFENISTTATKIIMPNTITCIGAWSCNNVKEIIIPESVKEIRINAFDGSNLSEIIIPKSVEKIENYAFVDIPTLKYVYIKGNNTIFDNNGEIESIFCLYDFSEDEPTTIVNPNLTIVCNPGSTAEAYAKANGIKYAYEYIDPTIISSGSENDFIVTADATYFDDTHFELENISESYENIENAYNTGKNVWLCVKFDESTGDISIKAPMGGITHVDWSGMAFFSVSDGGRIIEAHITAEIFGTTVGGGSINEYSNRELISHKILTDDEAPATAPYFSAEATKEYVAEQLANFEGGGSVDIVDDLTSADTDKALSANQGRVLNEKLEGTETIILNLSEENPIVTVPDGALTSLCDFTFTPKTQNIGHGLDRILPDSAFKDLINFEMPIFTSHGNLLVKDKEGNLKYSKNIDSLINYKNVADILFKDGILKKWSDKFYFNSETLNIVDIQSQYYSWASMYNYVYTLKFSKEDFINIGIPKESSNANFISSCLYMRDISIETYSATPNPAKFYYENEEYYLKIRVYSSKELPDPSSYLKSLFSYTKAFICYELQTPYVIQNYFAMGLSSGDTLEFKENNTYYSGLDTRVKLLYDSDLKKWITQTAGETTPINTFPTTSIEIPTSYLQVVESFDQTARMLNNRNSAAAAENKSQWIGEGDGKTDYTQQIQSKIDEMKILKGGEVYLGKGTYPISSSLIIYDNISLIGEGDKTLLEMTSDNTHGVIVSGSHINIKDLAIKLKGSCSENTACIYINSNNVPDKDKNNQLPRPLMPTNQYCQYNNFSNLNLRGTYAFDWEGNYVKISDDYENYFGHGIMCESLFFNYANIDNVKISNMCHGMHGVGGSNKISIYCEGLKVMVYDDAGGGYCDIAIFGHSYYGNGTDANHSEISMSDAVGYFKTLEQSTVREYVYDIQHFKNIFIFEGMTMNNRYLVSQIAGTSYFSNNNYESLTKRRLHSFVKDLGRGNRNIEEFKKVPYHIGNYFDGYIIEEPLTSYKENDPILHNALSGAGIWGNITSNTTFTGLPLNNICRYPKDGYGNLTSSLSNTAPSETTPIEIEINISNRPFSCQPNFFIQFDGKYVASDFSVSFDTTNNGIYDKTYEIVDNSDIVYSLYNHQANSDKIYRIKISFTKALSIPNFEYQNSNYDDRIADYNLEEYVGIVNFGIVSDEYTGRAFLGECGGSLYGELDMNSNTLKNIADPVDINDAVNKKYVDTAISNAIGIVLGGAS